MLAYALIVHTGSLRAELRDGNIRRSTIIAVATRMWKDMGGVSSRPCDQSATVCLRRSHGTRGKRENRDRF